MKECLNPQSQTIKEKPFLFREERLCTTIAEYNIQRGYDPEKGRKEADATFSRICFLSKINENLPRDVIKLPLQKVLQDVANPYNQITVDKKSSIRQMPEKSVIQIDNIKFTVAIYKGKYNTFINVFPIPFDDDNSCWIMNNETRTREKFFIMNKKVLFAYLTSNQEYPEIIAVPKPKENKTEHYIEKPFLWLADEPYTEKQKKQIIQMVKTINLTTEAYKQYKAVAQVTKMLQLSS